MNKLKRILLREATAFIPFAFTFNKLNKYWDYEGDSKIHGRRTQNRLILTNSLINCIPVGYLFLSICMGSLNYRKWSEISKQNKIEKETNQKNYLKEQFNKADVNKDYFIDSTEFYNYSKSK